MSNEMTNEKMQAHLVSGATIICSIYTCRSASEPLFCADGTRLSVQARSGSYCTPRSDEGPYSHVEVGFPSKPVPEFMPYAEDPDRPTDTVYGYVPVQVVIDAINSRGGLAESEAI
jgi:hypothetical protein